MNDMPMDISQTPIKAVMAERQTFMVQTEQVQHGRVQVVDVNFVLHGGKPKFVRCAVNRAALDAAPSQPHGKAKRIVIPSVAVL